MIIAPGLIRWAWSQLPAGAFARWARVLWRVLTAPAYFGTRKCTIIWARLGLSLSGLFLTRVFEPPKWHCLEGNWCLAFAGSQWGAQELKFCSESTKNLLLTIVFDVDLFRIFSILISLWILLPFSLYNFTMRPKEERCTLVRPKEVETHTSREPLNCCMAHHHYFL